MNKQVIWNDERMESAMGNLLRAGVILAAAIVLIGGCFYLAQYGSAPLNYSSFHSEPLNLRSIPGILGELVHLHGPGIIQFGVLLLIATPILRVVFAVIGFGLERDMLYTVVSLIVLFVLLFSLLTHAG